jgi:NAD(P)-dependent dehydrogenase (short-subunit alcohol dehydrogenase family)
LCLRLADLGYDVVVNYLTSEAAAAALAAEIGVGARGASAWCVRADISVAADVSTLFATADSTGRELGLVINNVGIYDPVPLSEIGGGQWERTMSVNLNGAFHVCRHALRRLRRGGQIISIGVAGNQLNRAEGFATDYYVSKAALLQLTRALAVEHAPDGVRLNMVSPGQLSNSIGEAGGMPGKVPAGRDGSFEDVFQAVEYLLGAEYVTGANIEVAGGYRL